MRLPETDLTLEDTQEEIVGLAEDIVDINEKLDSCFDIEKQICENCIDMCECIDDANKWIVSAHKRVDNILERISYLDDKIDIWKVGVIILTFLFLVWCWILTYKVCNGI